MCNLKKAAKLPPLSEQAFQKQVLDLAKLCGWLVAHFRPAWTGKGWRTPVQADGAGFPDLVLVKPPRLIFAELKAQGRKTTPDQDKWLDILRTVPGVEVYLWTVDNFDDIISVLR